MVCQNELLCPGHFQLCVTIHKHFRRIELTLECSGPRPSQSRMGISDINKKSWLLFRRAEGSHEVAPRHRRFLSVLCSLWLDVWPGVRVDGRGVDVAHSSPIRLIRVAADVVGELGIGGRHRQQGEQQQPGAWQQVYSSIYGSTGGTIYGIMGIAMKEMSLKGEGNDTSISRPIWGIIVSRSISKIMSHVFHWPGLL